MNRFRSWLQKVLYGRNGSDELARMYAVVGCVLLLLSLLVPQGTGKGILSFVGLVVVILSYFRIFSRNVYKRQAENQHYLQWKNGVAARFRQWNARRRQSKDYCFFRCTQCRTMTRVPRGRGKIEITCPKCGNKFVRKS